MHRAPIKMWKLIVLFTFISGTVSTQEHRPQLTKKKPKVSSSCPTLERSKAHIDTVTIFPTLKFNINYEKGNEFWNEGFEDRYLRYLMDTRRPTLKVYVVPHSHNDPMWLETFNNYFNQRSRHIINNIVTKLKQLPNMTFVWNEISFLSAWWETALPMDQEEMKKLVREGRLEITTGGWVMADEACTHIYALIDQFIEGHTWVKTHLGIIPNTGWSIDPFGHGPTVPYLLDRSGFNGSIIQRVHYAWKRWLAQKQTEDFYWISGWRTKKPSMVMHHQPFSIYNIPHSCGPHTQVCQEYDFAYSLNDRDYSILSEKLVGEYGRIGSLTQHNVVLVPLGDDFKYINPEEFDGQYNNYMKIFNYINSHKELFHAEVQFGTPREFFVTVSERHKKIPTLNGDFFVYADFSKGGVTPAYWSGYYTTRPYAKILARQLEHHLRTAEILFTFAKQSENIKLGDNGLYELLVNARQSLGQFQHHDGITGTSVEFVMAHSTSELSENVHRCARVQTEALHALMLAHSVPISKLSTLFEYDTYRSPVNNAYVSFSDGHKIIVFNPLTESRTDVITVRIDTARIRIYDEHNMRHILYQISPIIAYYDSSNKWNISDSVFELIFVASVPALSTRTYTLEPYYNTSNNGFIYCKNCQSSSNKFIINKDWVSPIHLENSLLKLIFNTDTGFLQQIYRKDIRKEHKVKLNFGAYESQIDESGAYLFKPKNHGEKNVLDAYRDPNIPQDNNILIVSGPVYTEITTMYLPFLVHTVRIFNVNHPVLARAVLVENDVDFGSRHKNRDTELFMRIQTDIQNGDVPEFYTDQNGFQYQKRVKVDKLGIEANYYPITTMAWLQDEETRLTLVTNHAQGAAAFEPGQLEVMLDRRIFNDDQRGMNEGVLDNQPISTYHWIMLESMPESISDRTKATRETYSNQYEVPSQAADHLSRTLNYPLNMYLLTSDTVDNNQVKSSLQLANKFPPGIHLVTLRTIPEDPPDHDASKAAYLVLQRPGYSCNVGHPLTSKSATFTNKTILIGPNITNITSVSLTGLKTYNQLLDMSEIHLEPMELKTYQLTFS